ncbi:hypothetical protein GCM10025861_23850 [Methanobacterium petrolearium]|nr:hypothetical protein GCM10025861_23850 [Methanobacterium petrolearium]
MDAVEKIRDLDPSNIFTKDRGFPPGDPRRCRAKRGAAREGFHQLEKEYELLEYVCDALENPEKVSLKNLKKSALKISKKLPRSVKNEYQCIINWRRNSNHCHCHTPTGKRTTIHHAHQQ